MANLNNLQTHHTAAMPIDLDLRRAMNPPSLMVRRFLEDDYSSEVPMQLSPSSRPASSKRPEDDWPSDPFRIQYCFFYGTLMDPGTLAKVLQLSEMPKMRPARVIGYEVKLWGPYPALVDGPTNHPVDGVAYEIQLEEHLDRLTAYETDKYLLRSCLVDLLDGADGVETIEGVHFRWNGEPEELREGKFNLEEWLQSRS